MSRKREMKNSRDYGWGRVDWASGVPMGVGVARCGFDGGGQAGSDGCG